MIAELAPLPGEPVLGQLGLRDVLRTTTWKQVLKDLGVETLVLAGVATDMAVLSAVFQASDLFYNLIVPSDASTSANPKFHEVALEMIDAMSSGHVNGGRDSAPVIEDLMEQQNTQNMQSVESRRTLCIELPRRYSVFSRVLAVYRVLSKPENKLRR